MKITGMTTLEELLDIKCLNCKEILSDLSSAYEDAFCCKECYDEYQKDLKNKSNG